MRLELFASRLVSVDGQPITTSTEFRTWVGKLRVGDTARVEVARAGAVSKVTVDRDRDKSGILIRDSLP